MNLIVLINSQNFAHKILGNQKQVQLFIRQKITLDLLKTEALDAFGLFDASYGEETETLESPEKKGFIKSYFRLSVKLP